MIGPTALLAAAIATILVPQFLKSRALQRGVLVAIFLIVAGLMIQTRRQCTIWRNSETLWHAALSIDHGHPVACFNLGLMAYNCVPPDLATAERFLLESLSRCPDYVETRIAYANVVWKTGRRENAVAEFRKALALAPSALPALHGLGNLLWEMNRRDEAIESFAGLVTYDATNPESYRQLGRALAASGRPNEAARVFERGLELASASPLLLSNFAWLLATDPDGTVRDGQRAVGLVERARAMAGGKDSQLTIAIAAAYAQAGDFDRARREVEDRIVNASDTDAGPMRKLLAQLARREPVRTPPRSP